MARQEIFTGIVGNDKTGDKLRIAFTKINENFTELYSNMGQDGESPTDYSPAFNQANDAFHLAQSAFDYANTIVGENTNLTPVFEAANNAYNVAVAAFDYANNNTGGIIDVSYIFDAANAALDIAKSAFDYANTIVSENTNLGPVWDTANAAFDKANTSVTDFSPAYNQANDAYALAVSAFDYANSIVVPDITEVSLLANLAFDAANTSPSMNLNSLTDVIVDYDTISVGDVLKWNGIHWESGIDATSGGGGTNADTLDGFHATYFLNYLNLANTPDLSVYATIGDMTAAFDKANSANVLAFNTGIGANAYAVTVGAASNTWANTLATTSRAIANSSANSANAYAITVGAASNTYANTLLLGGTGNVSFNNVTATNITANKFIKLGGTEEAFTVYNSVTGTTQFDCSSNYIFYVNPTGNFTANLTNFVLDSNYVTSVSLVVNQGATPYMHTNSLLIGSGTYTINWQGGTAPTGTASKKDIIVFSVFNVAGTISVLGQLVSFG